MLKKFVKNFSEINESIETPFKGKPATEFLADLQTIIGLCPKLQTIHYPADIHGHASHVATIISDRPGIIKEVGPEQAFEQISDELLKIDEFYKSYYKEGNQKEVTFYIWQASGRELRYNEIEKLLAAEGGNTTSQDIKPEELISYLEANPEIGEKITHISISLDSHGKRDFGQAMSSGKFGPLD
jgi:hypothetical protein